MVKGKFKVTSGSVNFLQGRQLALLLLRTSQHLVSDLKWRTQKMKWKTHINLGYWVKKLGVLWINVFFIKRLITKTLYYTLSIVIKHAEYFSKSQFLKLTSINLIKTISDINKLSKVFIYYFTSWRYNQKELPAV